MLCALSLVLLVHTTLYEWSGCRDARILQCGLSGALHCFCGRAGHGRRVPQADALILVDQEHFRRRSGARGPCADASSLCSSEYQSDRGGVDAN